mgnify:FL=1
MQSIDYNYIGTIIGSVFGIPTRIYKNNTLIFYYSTVNLIKDPVSIYQADILKITDRISYFMTAHFCYYGIVNSDNYKIVIGPASQVPNSTPTLRDLAMQLDIPGDDTDDFIIAMQNITHIPLESLMQILCLLNYILNDEKCFLHDVFIDDAMQKQFIEAINKHDADMIFFDELPDQSMTFHNTYDLEQNVMNMVRKGDYMALTGLIEKSAALKIGTMSNDQLRQLKDTFIVTTTLVSRSAIHGGMNPDEAFTLSDNYIQKCESSNDYCQIINLRYLMVIDFARHVNRLQEAGTRSQLVSDVANYIDHHMSETITVEAMAKEFYMSRSYLSKRFKAESNITLTDFILNRKTEEAKHLLRYTDKPLTAISLYLGFSSPGHFSRVFRKYASMSPSDYRKKHLN